MDICTYSANSAAVLADAEINAKELVEVDAETGYSTRLVFNFEAPLLRNGNETLRYLRVDADTLASIKKVKSLKILANVANGADIYAAMSAANKAIHDRLYTVPTFDAEGNQTGVIQPKKMYCVLG